MYINLYIVSSESIQTLGHLSAFINEHNNDDDECTITSLFISEEYRNQGLATQLLKKLRKILIKTDIFYSKIIITLTDCSDHFGLGKENNVYQKVGFEYDEEGLPEMTWHFRERKYNEYNEYNEYNSKNFIIQIL